MRMPHAVVLAAALLAGVPVATAAPEASDAVTTLVAAERAFSALSVEKGMKEAFLAWLGHGAVLFRPGPVDGRGLWESRPGSPPGTLVWEPEFAEVSAFGDLGISAGPWEYRPPGGADPGRIGHGHFISVWKRPAGADWRVALDIGIDHARPARGGVGSGRLELAPPPSRVRAIRGAAMSGGTPGKLDDEFGKASRKGLSAALGKLAASDLRFHRSGAEPYLGREEAESALDTLAGRWNFDTRGFGLATSQDLAYTYGLAMRSLRGGPAPVDTSVYLHVWRRDPRNRWKLSLAVLNPM